MRLGGRGTESIGAKKLAEAWQVGQVQLPVARGESACVESARERGRTAWNVGQGRGEAGAMPAAVARVAEEHVVLRAFQVSSQSTRDEREANARLPPWYHTARSACTRSTSSSTPTPF